MHHSGFLKSPGFFNHEYEIQKDIDYCCYIITQFFVIECLE